MSFDSFRASLPANIWLHWQAKVHGHCCLKWIDSSSIFLWIGHQPVVFPRNVPLNVSKPYHERIHPPAAFLIYLPGFPSIRRSAAVSLVLAKLLSRFIANKLLHQRNLLHTININHSLNEDYSSRGHFGNCGMTILITLAFNWCTFANLVT